MSGLNTVIDSSLLVTLAMLVESRGFVRSAGSSVGRNRRSDTATALNSLGALLTRVPVEESLRNTLGNNRNRRSRLG